MPFFREARLWYHGNRFIVLLSLPMHWYWIENSHYYFYIEDILIHREQTVLFPLRTFNFPTDHAILEKWFLEVNYLGQKCLEVLHYHTLATFGSEDSFLGPAKPHPYSNGAVQEKKKKGMLHGSEFSSSGLTNLAHSPFTHTLNTHPKKYNNTKNNELQRIKDTQQQMSLPSILGSVK